MHSLREVFRGGCLLLILRQLYQPCTRTTPLVVRSTGSQSFQHDLVVILQHRHHNESVFYPDPKAFVRKEDCWGKIQDPKGQKSRLKFDSVI